MGHAAVMMFAVGIGGCAGVLGWCAAGQPVGYFEGALAAGVAVVCMFLAGCFWYLRAAIASAPRGATPEDAHLEHATEEEFRRDLKALADGDIDMQEYCDRRWERPAPPRPRKRLDLVGLFREIMSDPQYAGGEAMASVLSIPVNDEPSVEKLHRGDVVRVIYPLSYMYKRLPKLEGFLATVGGGPAVWNTTWGGSEHQIRESDFILAVPRKGEVWRSTSCESCGTIPLEIIRVAEDWPQSEETRRRVNCGCLYRMGEMS